MKEYKKTTKKLLNTSSNGMKKIFSKIIISFVLFSFIIPLSINLNRSEVLAAETWYYTRLGDIGYTDRVNSIDYAMESDCLKDLKSVHSSREPSTVCYKKNVVVQTENNTEGTYWFRDMDNAFRGTLGPLKLPGFTTSQECENAKNTYWGPNSNNAASKLPCYLISSEQVLLNFELEKQKNAKMPGDDSVPITPKIGATENNNIYKMLVPLPGITCMDNTGKDPSCIGNNVGTYLNFIFKFGIGLCAALAVVMLIIYGITYMGDESIFGKTEAKKKMFGAIIGLIIAIGGWALLNTINPDLTGKNGLVIDSVEVKARTDDPDFIQNISSLDTKNVTALSFSDPLFKGYLAHQQGPAGAAAIIWATSKGLNEVPSDNPFTNSPVNTNMKSNFPATDATKVIGTSVLTPANFLRYWSLKTAAAKAKTGPIFPAIEAALKKVSSETGVPLETLVAICRIESAAGCTNESSITKSNGSFQGLFQIGSAAWNDYGNKNGNILDPYENALAAAKYYKSNLQSIQNLLSKNS
ncbi:hypothetical protein A2467_03025 [Candidatus Nomurabacteria bacterium RIFOXYC2_FULL_36_8]|nr:MAG: hypothetical protein A2467_03025 [Candidatus Nomurabacteria bacterium RIFOXYC2_FULL_36_8]